jgi:hypothetical protein
MLSVCLVVITVGNRQTAFEDVAIVDGESYYASIAGVRIHCTGVADADACIDGAKGHPEDSVFLWLGNSQLHAVNQYRPGDVNATPLLHEQLLASGRYLVTFSEPNANLQEHLILFAYLLPRLHPRDLLLPLVFDDFREAGVRPDLVPALEDSETAGVLGQSEIGVRLLREGKRGSDSGDDLAGIHHTLQERSERTLNGWLENRSAWAQRPEARGEILLFLYESRNTLLGIKPTTARRVIPGRFADNWAALEAILSLAESEGIHVYAYIAPIRNDVTIPYDPAEYEAFKTRVGAALKHRKGVSLANLESVVPNQYWGTKAATAVGGEPEYDFMHFQAAGHRYFAEAIEKYLDGGAEAGS